MTRGGGATRSRPRVHLEVRRSHIIASVQPEQARAMKNGDYFNSVGSQAIHDSVIALDDLAERLVTNLRHHPA